MCNCSFPYDGKIDNLVKAITVCWYFYKIERVLFRQPRTQLGRLDCISKYNLKSLFFFFFLFFKLSMYL